MAGRILMNKSRVICMLSAACLLLAFTSSPVRAIQESTGVVEVTSFLSLDGVYAGNTVKAAIVLKIRPGYHINDNAPLDEFMFPTSLSFEAPPGLEVLEIYFPPGHPGRFAYADNELIVYEGETVLGALLEVKIGQAPGELKLTGTLSYQACDNVSCLPPKEVSFEVPVTVVAGDRKTTEQHPEIFARIPFKTMK
jgi:thiol:disulfide interchange protein DsbD